MCVCRDGTVRIVTPGSGDVLTTYLADDAQQGVVDAAYAGNESKFYVTQRWEIDVEKFGQHQWNVTFCVYWIHWIVKNY